MNKTFILTVLTIVSAVFLTITSIFWYSQWLKIDKPTVQQSTEKMENISEQDMQTVREQTENLVSMFEKDSIISESDLVEIQQQYMKTTFNEGIYPDPFQRERWLGINGIGHLASTEVTSENGRIQVTALKGKITNYEITTLDQDEIHHTITVYLRIQIAEENTYETHWIEWERVPGEGWRINSLSFSGGVEALEDPLSPKRRR